ncbi:hypothetical protein AVEN_11098-1 [Araneus ventricosus]|uniref:Uncharacterized protein n=1 Tax=Araneus ventricosus TaxID=182803 RepID=A0A4Y2RPP9_ARAVE|nr:hypothetical protein AVEN_11098-1 [Araneus ventricosus]
MKSALMTHLPGSWLGAPPLVTQYQNSVALLLGNRTRLFCYSVSKLGCSITCCQDSFCSNTRVTTPASSFLQTLRRHVRSFRPVPTSHHSCGPVFVIGDILKASHEFLKIDGIHKSLEPPYAGPFKVLLRTSKVFTVEVKGRPVTVSIDRLKATHMFPGQVASKISSPIPTCSARRLMSSLDMEDVHGKFFISRLYFLHG